MNTDFIKHRMMMESLDGHDYSDIIETQYLEAMKHVDPEIQYIAHEAWSAYKKEGGKKTLHNLIDVVGYAVFNTVCDRNEVDHHEMSFRCCQEYAYKKIMIYGFDRFHGDSGKIIDFLIPYAIIASMILIQQHKFNKFLYKNDSRRN